ncbi:Na+/H+ antiporter subunit E [Paraglaciecola polaris]|uniref:Na+/H+ antiporter subunit E n=1 Tax=Paraglaciecola polaris TaxID=222814 RepID=UPI0030EF912A|tara:strand:+ start:131 stop:610 length:480 start_codon:yes stop_codon:yes gene_type:complete
MKRHTISLFLTLALFWLLNSGQNTVLILFLAAASIVFVLIIAHQMDVVDQESQPLYLTRNINIFGYYLWLIKVIIKANIIVVKHIFLSTESISPSLKKIRISQKTDMGKVIYANSITLTPGTIVIDLCGDEILVHALLYEDIETLKTGEMNRRVSMLER